MESGGRHTDHLTAPIRVLLVDDDSQFSGVVQDYLERADDRFRVAHASDATDAVEHLTANHVDCVVSDYEMPGRNGLELLAAVRDDDPDLPFILYTGRGGEAVASDAISAGVTDYLRKEPGADQYAVLANRVENAVERYRSKRALGERNRRLETLISNLPGMVYRCANDPGWPMEFVGGECKRLTGYSVASLEAGDVLWGEDVVHPGDAERVWTAVQSALDAGDPFEVTYRIVTRSGTEKHVWERGRSIREDGDSVALEGFITDITDRREYERELERQNDRLEEFAGIVSHDLRNPLNVAIGRLEIARENRDSPHLESVADAHDRMRTLIEDLLSLARQGDLVTDFDGVALSSLARDCWRNVDTRQATLDVVDDLTVLADENRLSQLLENLFRNAVEHGSTGNRNATRSDDAVEHGSTGPDSQARQDAVEHGSTSPRSQGHEDAVEHGSTSNQNSTSSDDAVEYGSTSPDSQTQDDAEAHSSTSVTVGSIDSADALTAADAPGTVGFYVADDGPGLPEADRDRVFEPGYTTTPEGTGFGLAIVDDIADAHGWSVSVTDSETGGARFEITGVKSP